MPPAVCGIPERVRAAYDRIAAINGGKRGCWDVLAWSSKAPAASI
jgi:hypothetical protein